MTDDFFGDDDDPSSLPDNHTSTLLRPSSPTHTSLDYRQTTSYQSSSRPDTSSHRHQTSSRRADTSSRRGAADTSSLARGRSPDLDLDDILAGMDVDHDGVEGGVGGGERSVVRLERCLANEQGAPELLEFPVELVEGLVTDLAARVSDGGQTRLVKAWLVERWLTRVNVWVLSEWVSARGAGYTTSG